MPRCAASCSSACSLLTRVSSSVLASVSWSSSASTFAYELMNTLRQRGMRNESTLVMYACSACFLCPDKPLLEQCGRLRG